MSGVTRAQRNNRVFGSILEKELKNDQAAYTVETKYLFPGTDKIGTIKTITIIARVQDATKPGDIRIFDADNTNTIAEKTGIADLVDTKHDLGTISNLPTGEAIFEIQMRVPLVAAKEDFFVAALNNNF